MRIAVESGHPVLQRLLSHCRTVSLHVAVEPTHPPLVPKTASRSLSDDLRGYFNKYFNLVGQVGELRKLLDERTVLTPAQTFKQDVASAAQPSIPATVTMAGFDPVSAGLFGSAGLFSSASGWTTSGADARLRGATVQSPSGVNCCSTRKEAFRTDSVASVASVAGERSSRLVARAADFL